MLRGGHRVEGATGRSVVAQHCITLEVLPNSQPIRIQFACVHGDERAFVVSRCLSSTPGTYNFLIFNCFHNVLLFSM